MEKNEIKNEKALQAILGELNKAEKKWPRWPLNLFEQLAVVGEEFGELQQAVLQAKHEYGKAEHIREEAIHLAAMAVRFLKNLPYDLERYNPADWTHCEGCGETTLCSDTHLDCEGMELCDGCVAACVEEDERGVE